MKKYELTTDSVMACTTRLFRIKALIPFGDVKAGEFGGYVEKEENLSQDGDAWVYGDAQVYGNAGVYGDARVYGNAKICGNAQVCGNADYTTVKGFGSEYRNTTFLDNLMIALGLYAGALAEPWRNLGIKSLRPTKNQNLPRST